MPISDILTNAEEHMKKAVSSTENEFTHIRTGRANPAMLDGISVDYYGTPTPLSQVSNITTPEPRSILITPWDKGMISDISKSILNSDLSLNPSNDGTVIRLALPALTEDRRKEYVKVADKKGEDGKVAIRNIRRDAIDHIKKEEKQKLFSEDESKTAQEKVQKLTDQYIKNIDDVHTKKVADIMEV